MAPTSVRRAFFSGGARQGISWCPVKLIVVSTGIDRPIEEPQRGNARAMERLRERLEAS